MVKKYKEVKEMGIEMNMIVVISFILLIKPFRYFLQLFLNEGESFYYKLAHIFCLGILCFVLLLAMNDLKAAPFIASHSKAISLYLIAPFLMVLSIYVSSLFLFFRTILKMSKQYKLPAVIFSIIFLIFSLISIQRKSSLFFDMIGGGPENKESVIFGMSWINEYTISLVFNGYLFLFVTSITIIGAALIHSDSNRRGTPLPN